MRRLTRRNKANLLQLQAGQCFLRQAQMTEMNWVEGAAEDSKPAQNLTPHMPIAEHDEFLRG